MDLEFEVTEQGGWVCLAVRGEVDVYTAPRLREQLQDFEDSKPPRVVVDLTKVDFMDSTGLGVLVGGQKRFTAVDGELRVVCTQPTILKIFEITQIDAIMPIFPSVDAALSST